MRSAGVSPSSPCRALWDPHCSSTRRPPCSQPQGTGHPSLGPLCPPTPPGRHPRPRRLPRAEGRARGRSRLGGQVLARVNRSFLSAWGVGAGGGSCLELCYVLKKKKGKKFGSQTTNCFDFGSTGTNRHFLWFLASGAWAGWAGREGPRLPGPGPGTPRSGPPMLATPVQERQLGARPEQLGGAGTPGQGPSGRWTLAVGMRPGAQGRTSTAEVGRLRWGLHVQPRRAREDLGWPL